MQDYTPNSNKFKKEQQEAPAEKKIEKVVSGTVKTKNNTGRKLVDMFIKEDIGTVGSYLFYDVIIPNIVDGVHDVLRKGIDAIFLGKNNTSKKNTPSNMVSYNKCYSNRDDRRSYNDTRYVSKPDYRDIIIGNRGEAEEVLAQMNDIIREYEMVSIAELYELVGQTHLSEHTDNKYGWTDLRTAYVQRVSDGYQLKLPRVKPLD